jgi:4-amino-4-deoxy-L-arabinose transferase-like glycosyltransferase
MTRSTTAWLTGFILLAVVIAGTQLLVYADSQPGADSIAYFELADQIQTVGYAQALPLHWSPLYPAYVLAARTLGGQTIASEAHVTLAADAALLIALCAIVAATYSSLASRCFPDRRDAARAWLACAFGLALFFGFGVLRVGLRMPDALVTCLATLVLWTWCRAIGDDLGPLWAGLAGVLSGIAYLARANLLHWSLVAAAAACVCAPGVRVAKRWIAFGLFALGLLAIVGPQVYALSAARGYFTLGESGKLVFAETYGATWPNGQSWPVRASGGDVRVFTDARDLNFPGFYEPGREYDDAIVQFGVGKALLAVVRSVRATLFGYWSPSFALFWPLLWAAWPPLMFGVGVFGGNDSSPDGRLRRRLSAFLIISGAAGVAMHLVSFSLGYYLPPYLIPLLMGIYLAMIGGSIGGSASFRRRAAWIVASGLAIATVLTTASGFRRSDERGRSEALADSRALATALERLPADGGRRRLAVAGPWLGVYAIRLSNSQVTADIPDPAVLHDADRARRAVHALRDRGVVAILQPRSRLAPDDPLTWTAVNNEWALADIRDVPVEADVRR